MVYCMVYCFMWRSDKAYIIFFVCCSRFVSYKDYGYAFVWTIYEAQFNNLLHPMVMFSSFTARSHWEHGRCVFVALPVGYLLELSTKPVTTRTITAARAGCVRRQMDDDMPSQRTAAEMLPVTTHDPTYSSWTPRGPLQTRSASLSRY